MPGCFTPKGRIPEPNGQEAWWASEPFWMFNKDKILPCPEMNCGNPANSLSFQFLTE
jgi:hypothetical protein